MENKNPKTRDQVAWDKFEKFKKSVTVRQLVSIERQLLQIAFYTAYDGIERKDENGAYLRVIPQNKRHGTPEQLENALYWMHDRHRDFWASYPTAEPDERGRSERTLGPGNADIFSEARARAKEEKQKTPESIALAKFKKAKRTMESLENDRQTIKGELYEADTQLRELGIDPETVK